MYHVWIIASTIFAIILQKIQILSFLSRSCHFCVCGGSFCLGLELNEEEFRRRTRALC